MPIESAADRAVFVNPDEFGAQILWPPAPLPISALLQNGTLLISTQDGPDVQTREATLVVNEADLPVGHAEDDAVTVSGVEYLVRSVEPDGTGMAIVRLELADG